jgi:hypothetical protein
VKVTLAGWGKECKAKAILVGWWGKKWAFVSGICKRGTAAQGWLVVMVTERLRRIEVGFSTGVLVMSNKDGKDGLR